MASVSYYNLSALKAMAILAHEIYRFLDGWGDLDSLTVSRIKKDLTIRIEPKD